MVDYYRHTCSDGADLEKLKKEIKELKKENEKLKSTIYSQRTEIAKRRK